MALTNAAWGIQINTPGNHIDVLNNTHWGVPIALHQWEPNDNILVFNNFSSSTAW